MTEKAIYITSYPLDNKLSEKLVPLKLKPKPFEHVFKVKSGIPNITFAEDKSASVLPVFKSSFLNKNHHSPNQERWAIKPVMAKRKVHRPKSLRKSTKVMKKNSLTKRSFTRRKARSKNKLPKSDGENIKKISSIPSSNNLLGMHRSNFSHKNLAFQSKRLEVADVSAILLSAEKKRSSSRRSSTVRTKRGDALKKVNSNLDILHAQILL